METCFFRKVAYSNHEFKSYYVVWKLIFSEISRERRWEFKSYYVVWKRHEACNGCTYPNWFKSYYVVWKLLPISA